MMERQPFVFSLGDLGERGGGLWAMPTFTTMSQQCTSHDGQIVPMHASWQPAPGVILSRYRLAVAIDCDRCAYAPALTCGDQGRFSRIRGHFVGK